MGLLLMSIGVRTKHYRVATWAILSLQSEKALDNQGLFKR